MRILIAACLATLSVVSAHRVHVNQPHPHTDAQLEQLFTQFVKQHNKQYTQDEFFNRFHVFKTNVEKIRKHNLTGAKYTLGLNEFADQTWSEFRSARLGYKHQDRSVLRAANEEDLSASASAPTSVDWRTKNIITPVKNQGQCGSCWAFSTTGSVEAAHATATGTLTSLSEQQLVDCSTAQGNQGCNGGLMDNAFQYIISNKGIGTEASYPYKGTGPNTCKKVSSVATISSFKDVTVGSESALLTAVAGRPVSVAIEADQESFQLYSGGVLTAKCGTNLDHGVLAVGYGTDNGTDYWIVKNSWGASWGENGYIRLERGINQCGIANSASYPIA